MIINEVRDTVFKIKNSIEAVIIGKSKEIEVVLSAFFSGKHVLLEDAPGTGKTMLAKTLAKIFDLKFSRVQFTPDLLPSDITGLNVYNPKTSEFVLKRGAVFSNILLADEINRATPRTQSALLECMEEKQVTIDGVTHKLAPPFFTVATQNPIETQGTYPLPEAQLDRFAVKLSLGYPTKAETVDILKNYGKKPDTEKINAGCSTEELAVIHNEISNVFISDELLLYIAELTEKTRKHGLVTVGVSVRGSIALMDICKAYAVIKNRRFVIPDDIQYLLPYVFPHRMIYRGGSDAGEEVVSDIIKNTEPPVEKWDKQR